VSERALIFECDGRRLIGIVATPARCSDSPVGVLIVVGGPQYRAGSHRQFVLLARRLAHAGYPNLRFDSRGMGDSEGEPPGFENSAADIKAAADVLCESAPAVRNIVLWGLCDAASAAMMFCSNIPRVGGLVLLNPWVRSETSLASTHVKHYYRQRLFDPGFWRKVGRGEFDYLSSARSIAASLRTMLGRKRQGLNGAGARIFQEAMAHGLRNFRGRALLILSGKDLTAKEFLEYAAASDSWGGLLTAPGVDRIDLPEADHTFSTARWRAVVEDKTLEWLRSF